MVYAFDVKNAHKNFGKTKALDGVSLKSEPGKIFGLLGPNGAGKTTLVRLMSTLITPDQGSIKILGIDVMDDPQAVRRVIGLAGQFAAIDEYLTGRENIYMVARLYHLPKAEAKSRTNQLLNDLNLTDAADRIVRTYSGGMRRRLDLGASLVGHPKILFLDEPTTGLDPKSRADVWQIIRDLVKEGTSILLTTQYLEEADELADMIAVINRGKVIAEGTSDSLKAQLGNEVVELKLNSLKDAQKALDSLKGLTNKKPSIDEASLTVRLPVNDGSKSLAAIVRQLDKVKLTTESINLHKPSLDDVFLNLIGKTAKSLAKPIVSKKVGQR